MKVYPGSEIKQLNGVQKKQAVRSTQETGKTQEGDKVDFSSTLQQIQGQGGDLTSDPVRQARVQAVKEQIADGNYRPDSLKVAASLLKYFGKGDG